MTPKRENIGSRNSPPKKGEISMGKLAQKTATTKIKHTEELKLAIKRFVVLNIANLLPLLENDTESVSDIVTELITQTANVAIDELVVSLAGIDSRKRRVNG
jgi:hypothetical protein